MERRIYITLERKKTEEKKKIKRKKKHLAGIMHPLTHPPIILISSEVARSLHHRETFFLFPFSSTLCCISFLPSNFPVMKPSSRHQSFMPSYFIMYPNLSLFSKKKKKRKLAPKRCCMRLYAASRSHTSAEVRR